MTTSIHETPSSTPNFQTELARKLATLAPEAIADGKVDFVKLKELLSADLEEDIERFGLSWPGKRRALRAAQLPTNATLRPDVARSKNWETTKNVFIEGDNLEVLKLLQKYYHGKIKLIYIDPPYNTGKDFVYPDNFTEGLQTYLEWTRQVSSEGKKLSTNTESAGRYHSRWLNMMYPRLKLARNLLADDGLIFTSISDGELGHLSRLMAEIFGEDNFIETFVWQSIFRPSNMSRRVRRNAEYIVCYARNSTILGDFIERLEDAQGEASLTQNNNSVRTLMFPAGSLTVQLPDGRYPAAQVGEVELLSDLVVLRNRNSEPLSLRGRFKWSQQYLDEEIGKGVFLTIKTRSFIPYYRKDYQKTALRPTKILPRDLVGDVLQANAELDQLGLAEVFDYPKPTSLLRQLMAMSGVSDGDIVLDFFAGSGSAAHAVLALNAADGGSRRFIAVQLPEPVSADSAAAGLGLNTVSEIARHRIDLAGQALAAAPEQRGAMIDDLDIGFRFYKLADTNFAKWHLLSDTTPNELEQVLLELRDSAKDDATPDDLLAELLLKQGFSLSEATSTHSFGGLESHVVRDSDGEILVVAYLNEHVKPTLEQLRDLLHDQPPRIMVLEDAFGGDDELKTNLAQLCKSSGVELWTA